MWTGKSIWSVWLTLLAVAVGASLLALALHR
jgi:hypothetical protein